MGEMGNYRDNWNEQLEEVIALRSILGSDFRLLGFDGCPKWDESGDLTELTEWQIPHDPVAIHCQVNIFVEVPVDGVLLSVASPCSSDARSHETDKGDKVHHLPPLCLNLDLVPEYPSEGPPEFRLSAFWLTGRQISMLAGVLDQMWSAQPGSPICFEWIDWLQRSLLEAFNFQTEILFDPQPVAHAEELDHRVAACADEIDAGRIVSDIVQHDRIRTQHKFEQRAWSCPICMEEAPGGSFVRFHECSHYFCRECFQQYCLVNIGQGNVTLDCPAHKCTTPIGPSLLKRHLPKETFDRWETLLLQRTLETMSDVTYCPRCSTAAIQAEDSFAQCSKCLYAFCTECFDAYHPGRICTTIIEKIKRAEQAALEEKERAEQAAIEKLERKRYLEDLKNQMLSVKQMVETTKPCPRCYMSIEKNGGCNHMHCIYCNTHYCYLCGQVNIMYDHFGRGSCILFSQDAIDEGDFQMNQDRRDAIGEWQAQMDQEHEAAIDDLAVQIDVECDDADYSSEAEIDQDHQDAVDDTEAEANQAEEIKIASPEQQRVVQKRCPACGTPQSKHGRDNIVRCYVCSNRFCFVCNTLLPKKNPLQHFNRGCLQHSDN